MAGISGMGLTFNLPNYVGTLLSVSPQSTPFLSAIGGLTGGDAVVDKIFEWQTYDLRAAENPSNLEGQAAPTGRERVRANLQNAAQIFHSAVDLSYTVQAASGRRSGLPGDSGVGNEMDWQLDKEIAALKLDIEFAFLQGTFANPGTNASARKTQGIFGAVDSTHVAANGGVARAFSENVFLTTMQKLWEDGGIAEDGMATVICSPGIKRRLTDRFITAKGYSESTRNIGGVAVQTIQTDFGSVNIMMSRYVPKPAATREQMAIVSLDLCRPKFLLIPNKGFLFAEPLAKVGASDKVQIYGEVGLEYGHPLAHSRIDDLDPALAAIA